MAVVGGLGGANRLDLPGKVRGLLPGVRAGARARVASFRIAVGAGRRAHPRAFGGAVVP
jgi:hypothetical protein